MIKGLIVTRFSITDDWLVSYDIDLTPLRWLSYQGPWIIEEIAIRPKSDKTMKEYIAEK